MEVSDSHSVNAGWVTGGRVPSSGMRWGYQLNKTAVLVPNKYWNAAEDPTVSQLASKIVVNMNMNPNDVDNRLLAGDAQVDFAGTGVQAAARAKILVSPNLKSHADDPLTGFGWFFYIDSQVAPFTNLACRQAIEYAANHLTLQNAYGGPIAGGAIGSTVLSPTVAGYQKFDLYEATTKTQGDPAKAKQLLQACGQPNGFSTGIAYRNDRPTETQGAQALQQALSAVGGRHQDHLARVPDGELLRYLRRRAQVHGRAQHRDRLRRLGCRLVGRLWLPG